MSEHYKIDDLLQILLRDVIYPRHPNLVRNDSLTAKTIKIYLSSEAQHFESLKAKSDSLKPSEYRKLQELGYYLTLQRLSEESLRKYIRQLWKRGRFDFFFK